MKDTKRDELMMRVIEAIEDLVTAGVHRELLERCFATGKGTTRDTVKQLRANADAIEARQAIRVSLAKLLNDQAVAKSEKRGTIAPVGNQ